MSLKQTHTFALLELSQASYDEIAKKLRAAGYDQAFHEDGTIDMHGIGITRRVVGKSISARGRILTGKELRYAAENDIPVFYEEDYHDSSQGFYGVSRMEKAPVGYYIGDSDINPDEFTDDEVVMGNFPEGSFTVYEVKGNKYA